MKRRFLDTVAVLLVLFIVAAGAKIFAGQPFHFSSHPNKLVRYGMQYLPSSPTDLWTVTTHVDSILLHNVTGSDVTVTLADKSTNCNAGPCGVFTATTIAARQVWTFSTPGGIRFVNGISANASVANAVVAEIRGVQH